MAQARRIKPKTTKKKTPKKRKSSNLPWGLMGVILVSGIVLGMLINGAKTGNSYFGAGLKNWLEQDKPAEDSDEAIADLIENESVDKQFDFYHVLKDDDQFMPEDLPDSVPTRPNENRDFFLQAASFLKESDAEKLRARLALKGHRSTTQVRVNEGVTYFRVRLGPYRDKRKAKTAKNKLQKLGVKPFMYSVKK